MFWRQNYLLFLTLSNSVSWIFFKTPPSIFNEAFRILKKWGLQRKSKLLVNTAFLLDLWLHNVHYMCFLGFIGFHTVFDLKSIRKVWFFNIVNEATYWFGVPSSFGHGFSKKSLNVNNGEKNRDSLFTYLLTSEKLPSIWRIFLTKL